jgi:hypothetical protein
VIFFCFAEITPLDVKFESYNIGYVNYTFDSIGLFRLDCRIVKMQFYVLLVSVLVMNCFSIGPQVLVEKPYNHIKGINSIF